jgi:hypothetical protein
VVLSNSANSVNDIGLHLANSSYKIIAKAQREPGPD